MGNNIKQIKNRIKSVDSTLHVTKAMQLVASSKIKGAERGARVSAEYADSMLSAFSDIVSPETKKSVFISPVKTGITCYLVIAGDRGLAGGYNNNVFRLLEKEICEKDAFVIPIGKRSCEYCSRRGFDTLGRGIRSSEKVSDAELSEISRAIIEAYRENRFDSVKIISTKPVNVLTQEPRVVPVLPIPLTDGKNSDTFVQFEPSAEAVLDAAIEGYITSLLCSAVRESFLSELYARRSSMDSASKNASDMIDNLSLQYNRARQSSITQEITEIVAGAERH